MRLFNFRMHAIQFDNFLFNFPHAAQNLNNINFFSPKTKTNQKISSEVLSLISLMFSRNYIMPTNVSSSLHTNKPQFPHIFLLPQEEKIPNRTSLSSFHLSPLALFFKGTLIAQMNNSLCKHPQWLEIEKSI